MGAQLASKGTSTLMRFDCYGRFLLDIERHGDGWQVLQVSPAEGKRRLRADIVIPADVPESELERWLDDLLHEQGGPGRSIRRL